LAIRENGIKLSCAYVFSFAAGWSLISAGGVIINIEGIFYFYIHENYEIEQIYGQVALK
jgi:hypothetical protein